MHVAGNKARARSSRDALLRFLHRNCFSGECDAGESHQRSSDRGTQGLATAKVSFFLSAANAIRIIAPQCSERAEILRHSRNPLHTQALAGSSLGLSLGAFFDSCGGAGPLAKHGSRRAVSGSIVFGDFLDGNP
jgi:hypothetical protein